MKTNFAKLNLKNSHTHNQPIKNLIFEPFIIGDDDEQIQQQQKKSHQVLRKYHSKQPITSN